MAKEDLETYRSVAAEVAKIQKDHDALPYVESVLDAKEMEGVLGFSKILDLKDDETVVLGWVEFDSKEVRDHAHQKVKNDSKMNELISPLFARDKPIFEASRMVFGGFAPLVRSE